MAFRNGAYAKVWEVKPSANYTDARISISRKDKQTGEYTQDFGNYVRFIGDAHRMAAGLQAGDRIQLGEVSCTNQYNKERGVTYYNFQVYSFSVPDGNPATVTTQRPAAKVEMPDATMNEELPF